MGIVASPDAQVLQQHIVRGDDQARASEGDAGAGALCPATVT